MTTVISLGSLKKQCGDSTYQNLELKNKKMLLNAYHHHSIFQKKLEKLKINDFSQIQWRKEGSE